jgi:predicted amidophosphoribosyltransferase
MRVDVVIRRRPPRRSCEDCGEPFYRWQGLRCDDCVRALERPSESWRAFRKRVIEGKP